MGMYRDQLLPRALDLSMRRAAFAEQRAQVAAGLDGEVLEIGFGTGLNIPFYPAAVKRVLAVEPAGGGRAVAARRLAAQARAGRPVPVEFAGRKDSGLGQVNGRNAIRGYTHALPILIDRWGRKKENIWYPYADKTVRTLESSIKTLFGNRLARRLVGGGSMPGGLPACGQGCPARPHRAPPGNDTAPDIPDDRGRRGHVAAAIPGA